MRTDRRRQGQSGFTLIEVLVAMILLSVGLLGLQALSIIAARNTAQAGHRTELAAAATGALEAQTRAVHTAGSVTAQPEQCKVLDDQLIEVCTTIRTAGLPANSGRIEVQVRRTNGPLDPYSVSSHVFIPPTP